MLSSTSSSKNGDAGWALALLLTGILAYFLALEVIARTVVPDFSRVQREYVEDYRIARTLKPATASGATTALMVGNSLLRAGVDEQKLREAMAPNYSISLFPVDYTMYWDWYFGLRRLFADGARPAVVILSLSPGQLVSDSTNGERFARFMMRLNDLAEVKRAAGLNLTTASDYFFAHGSGWLGGRWEIRNWLFARAIPGATDLVETFVPKNVTADAGPETVERAVARLKALKQLVNAHGAHFVFSIPPVMEASDLAVEIKIASERADVPVLLPYRPGEMPRTAFTDGSHLDARGAALYVERLQPALNRVLSDAVMPHLVSNPQPLKLVETRDFGRPLKRINSVESVGPTGPFPGP